MQAHRNNISTKRTLRPLVFNWGKVLPHFKALLFFVAVSWGWAHFSWNKGVEYIQQSDTALYYFKVVMQYKHERALQSTDSAGEWQWSTLVAEILADQRKEYRISGVESYYQSAFERYLGTVYRVTGDVTIGYKILVFPLNLIFLLGAYALFFHLTKGPALSAFLAFLASFPIAVPVAGEYFGMGPVTIYSRRNFFTAFAPLAVYLFYRWIQNPRWLLVVFALVGLISNLHSSGILLAEILICTYLLFGDKSARSWGYAALYGLAVAIFGFIAIGGLWGRVESFFYGFLQIIVPTAYAAIHDFLQKTGMPEGLQFLFYPLRIYSHLPVALLHALTAVVALLACGALFVGRRVGERVRGPLLFFAALSVLAYLGYSEFKYLLLLGGAAFALVWRKRELDQKFELTHYLILVTFLVSFVGMLAFQAGYYLIDEFPLVSDQLRGVRFLGLLVFAWLAVLLSRVDWKGSGTWGRRLFIACAIVAITMTVRHDFRSWIRVKIEPDEIALLDLAKWSKANTPQQASFLVVSTRFGIVAERNVLIHERGARTTYGSWLLGRMQGGFPELKRLANEMGMDYIVVKKDNGDELPAGIIPVYGNQRYALVKVD